jgi:hypothetical protein
MFLRGQFANEQLFGEKQPNGPATDSSFPSPICQQEAAKEEPETGGCLGLLLA